ncbi:uncharacterized protein HMPREF1541_11023 [Cyphellophora europaea CBS 101466]|uniref:Zn(2)-C6 fungal-type domain-containing protein n=1 Tax=Cyphellophora europaea (strain CBS 101466) TaxID=1220924 RepID=W2S5E9_CYPE1|nr:uncharacterized protein HMPREF1541_11023 [Cyphellophora europaea CBS 101466]ETN43892.1 hypothetical protein HMPREF1541_11023 [Cyphellophora europaea CBS 101466]
MASAASQQSPTSERAPTARRRTAFACESCRVKKTRCDGQTPCSKCRESGTDCYFGTESVSTKAKSDVILNAILRVESSLGQLHDRVTVMAHRSPTTGPRAFADSPGSETASRSQPRQNAHSGPANGVDNAIISEAHTSTTEAVLGWSIFDSVPSLRIEQGGSIFSLENSRPALSSRRLAHPYTSEQDVDRVLYAFQRTVNFSYPIVTLQGLTRCRAKVIAGDLDDSLASCFSLLVMALGCGAEVVSELLPRENDAEFALSHHFRSLSLVYFDAAIKQIHNAYCDISTGSAQCLMLAALFYAYIQRPLQAWSMLGSAATKCRVLLSYGTKTADDSECIRRIFWSCFILESDYVSELDALPRFGVAEMESSIPLPGRFNTHGDPQEESHSSLYFLACISMRRLLNRVHHLLFAKDGGVSISDPRLPSMVSELDEQLTMWRDLLPPAFRFTVDTQPVESQHGAFLRQRYLTCKALIYRPYLMSALSRGGSRSAPETVEKCKVWLNACMLHILNLHSYIQTVMIDTWICALSMAGTMAMLLAANRTPSLQPCLGDDLFRVGPHLRHLLGRWMYCADQGISPSVERAVQWIVTIDDILQQDKSQWLGSPST